jgi:hypothetical protein
MYCLLIYCAFRVRMSFLGGIRYLQLVQMYRQKLKESLFALYEIVTFYNSAYLNNIRKDGSALSYSLIT